MMGTGLSGELFRTKFDRLFPLYFFPTVKKTTFIIYPTGDSINAQAKRQ
jgi:hypothetical protein